MPLLPHFLGHWLSLGVPAHRMHACRQRPTTVRRVSRLWTIESSSARRAETAALFRTTLHHETQLFGNYGNESCVVERRRPTCTHRRGIRARCSSAWRLRTRSCAASACRARTRGTGPRPLSRARRSAGSTSNCATRWRGENPTSREKRAGVRYQKRAVSLSRERERDL